MKQLILSIVYLLFLLVNMAYSQYGWQPLYYGMSGNQIQTFSMSGEYIYAGSFYGGIFYSTNNGDRWICTSPTLIDKSNNVFL